MSAWIGIAGCEGKSRPAVIKAPTDVVIARPSVREVTDYEEFTGHTEAVLNVQVRSRVTGYLDGKFFHDGDEVKEGDLLYEIDPRTYRMAHDRAVAAVDQAQARRNRLDADHRRASNLFRRGAIGRQEFDLISGNFAEAEAAVHVALARADTARQDLDFTRIHARMGGQLGRTLVDPGNLVRRNDTVLTDIVVADRLYVYFDLDIDAISRVRGLIDEGRVGAAGGKDVPLQVGTSDETDFPYRGLVNFSENKLDAATGTLRVRGTLDNPAPRILGPGLFVRVRLPVGSPHPALMVADKAVGSDQGKNFVYVVDAQDEVVYRQVEIGPAYDGTMRAIRRGLSADERVIVDGRETVRPGSRVTPQAPSAAPPAKTASL